MVQLNNINDLINELYPKYVDFWIKLCNIESHTPYKEGVDKVGTAILEFTKDLGYDSQVIPMEKCGDLVKLKLKGNGNKKPVCLTAHMDTVFPIGTLANHASRIDGDFLYALGAADCKGGIVSCLMTLEVLSKLGCLDKDVIILFNSEEENNGKLSNKQTINTICELAKDSACCLNTEMNRPTIPNGLCLERKGSYNFKISVKGASAHAGLCFSAGVNAILEASRKIIELEKLKDSDGITISTGTIKGGVGVNLVPDYCEFEINLRFFTEEQKQQALDYIDKIVKTNFVKGTTSTYEITETRASMPHSQKNYELLDKINSIYKSYNLPTYTPYKTWGGSDSGELTCSGVPTIDCFGVQGYEIHNTNEHASLSSLKDAVLRLVVATVNL